MTNVFRLIAYLSILLSLNIYAGSGQLSPDGILTASDPNSYRQFGSDIDLEGTRLVVTSPGDKSFYEFDFDTSGNPINETKITTSLTGNHMGGSNGIAVSGAYSMLGASAAGNGKTFTYTSGSLVTEKSQGGYAQRFGADVDIYNDGLAVHRIVGSSYYSLGDGAIYFYKDEMTNEQFFSPSWLEEDSYFGENVVLDGVIAVASGVRHENFSGIAAVYKYDGNSWSEVAVLNPSDIDNGDRFGESIEIFGDLIFVGAQFNDDQGNNVGVVYVFRTSDGGESWSQITKIYPYDDGRQFGADVAFDGNRLAVVGGSGTYIYETNDNGSNWSPIAQLELGSSYNVGISGEIVVLGAKNYDLDPYNNNGAVYIYNLGLHTADDDGDGLVDDSDNCPSIGNLDQSDIDNDDIGDVCDSDIDGDGYENINDDFPQDSSEFNDNDSDGVGDNTDNCITIANADQADDDGDGLGNACELDSDLDSVDDNDDNCPYDSNVDQYDADGDGVGDACETDTDGDGVSNESELAFGTNPNDPSDANLHSLAVLEFITSMKQNTEFSADTDTDQDGISDALEIVLGGDPNDANDSGLANQIKEYVVNNIGKSVPAMGGIGLLSLGLSMLGLGAVRLRR